MWSDCHVNGPYIAMTFDDGPSAKLTPQLLDILKARNMHVTFFVLGEMVKQHPEIVKRAIAEGHEVGNHSYDHPQLSKLSDEAVRSQLDRTKELITAATGKPLIYMRPPYGALTKEQRKWIHDDLGYQIILWDVDPLDWKRPGPSVVEDRILQGTRSGSIILSHDIHPGTVEAMPDTFDKLLAKGFKFVTVSELIAMNQPVPPKPGAAKAESTEKTADRPHATPRPTVCQPARQDHRCAQPVTPPLTRMGMTYKDPIVNDFLELRAELGTALFALNTLASENHASPESLQTLQNLQAGLKEPFLFVVAGRGEGGQEFAA